MPAFHLLRCNVDLGDDHSIIVYRDRTRPIVFPELQILQYIHGEDAVTEVHVVGQWETNNNEVLQRLIDTYPPETIQAVFPGNRPRLPMSDPSIPLCTLPVYKPRPTRPANPDPRLKPLDQFTVQGRPEEEAPELPPESEPTPEEIAAHAQDEEEVEVEDMGFGPGPDPGQAPRPEDMPRVVRDTSGHGVSRARTPNTLPDVNAGGSHAPGYRPTGTHRGPSAARETVKRG
jgi:hypothetical protein